ncbi:hypothetical protein [Vibrio parahaemolyticus]|nr:hypothetical protein [Vibrio parahaemolyticus]
MFEGIFYVGLLAYWLTGLLAYWLIDIDDFASPDSIALCQKELPL